MEEIVKYFEQIEKRLSALEAAEAKEPEQNAEIAALNQRLAELNHKLTEMSALVAALSAKNIHFESKLAALEARPAQVVYQNGAGMNEHKNESEATTEVAASESEEVKLDEETGLPELEVEFVDEQPAFNESEEVELDEETGLPELEVELVDEENAEEENEAEEIVDSQTDNEDAVSIEVNENKTAPTVAAAAPATHTIADTVATQTENVGSVVPKLEDIRKGITMGDRFLYQRELFQNNGELMSKTIDTLNKMQSLSEAMTYIQKNFGGWNKESNAYELFMNLLKRRW